MFHIHTLTLALGFLLSQTASAEILFEGIFAIERGGVRTGYMIQRYEVDPASKTRKVTTYQRTRVDKEHEGFDVTRSVSGMDYSPIEFSRRSVTPGVDETIKADLKGKSVANVDASYGKSGKIERTDSMPVPGGSLLGSFVYYKYDAAKLPVGKMQNYTAMSESAGRYSNGHMRLDGSKTNNGVNFYQLQDFFEGEDIESFIFPDGSPAGARNAHENTVVYLVPQRELATNGFEFPQRELIEIFGDLPEGQKNPVGAGGGKVDMKSLIKTFPVSKPIPLPKDTTPENGTVNR